MMTGSHKTKHVLICRNAAKYYARFEDDIGISSDSDKRRKQGKRRKTAAEALREKLSQLEPEDFRAPWNRDDGEFKREEEKPDLKTSIKPELEYNTVTASQIKTSATPFPDSVHIPQPDTITVACRKKFKIRKDKTHKAWKRESNDDERSRDNTPERQHDPITDSTTSSAFNYATAPDCANTDNEPLGTTTHFLPTSEPSRRVTDLLETAIHIKTKDPSINLRTESILLQDFVRDGRVEPLNKAESCTRHDLSYAKFSSCLLKIGIDTSRYELNFNHPSTAKLQISDETTLASFIRAARREARSGPANPTLYVSRRASPVGQSDSNTHARSSGRMLDMVSSSTNFTPMASRPLTSKPVTCDWMTSEPSPLHHYRPLFSSSIAPISIQARSKATRQCQSPSVKGFLPTHKHPSPGRQAQQEVISTSSDSDE